MEKIYRIYRIEHRIEGELQAVYIGYTSLLLRQRLSHHLHSKKCKFGQYWLAYTSGEHLSHRDELTITELASTNVREDAIAIEEEQTRIAKKIYGDKCLNNNIGNKHSEDTRKKISEVKKGIYTGSNNPKAQPCEYDNKMFGSYIEAYEYAKANGYMKTYLTFKYMIKKEQYSS